MIVEILILITLWLIACAGCAVIGFFVGVNNGKTKEVKRPPEPITQEQERLAEKIARETKNFYSYDGTKQTDFNTKV